MDIATVVSRLIERDGLAFASAALLLPPAVVEHLADGGRIDSLDAQALARIAVFA